MPANIVLQQLGPNKVMAVLTIILSLNMAAAGIPKDFDCQMRLLALQREFEQFEHEY